jgi:hypothetical protein
LTTDEELEGAHERVRQSVKGMRTKQKVARCPLCGQLCVNFKAVERHKGNNRCRRQQIYWSQFDGQRSLAEFRAYPTPDDPKEAGP